MSVAESISKSSKEVKDFWLENARLRAGLPPWANIAPSAGKATAALLTAGALLAGGAGGAALSGLWGGEDSPPAEAAPVEPGQQTIIERERGSLLQYLEDGGYHLPP